MTIAPRPNFLVILADDLGYSDLGCFGAEIATPHLDKLAGEGLRLTHFHTAAACSPTRSMLLSGTDNHIAGMGAMNEIKNGEGGERWRGKPGHEGYLNERVAALPEVLQEAGYTTLMSGKWHLGLDKHLGPQARGFDKSYSMLSGCHNHYAYEPQFRGKEPGVTPEGDELTFKTFSTTIYDKRNMYARDGDNFEPETNFPVKDDGFYSTDTFTDELLGYLDERKRDGDTKPFFAYLAYTAPHWPLQAPKAVREKYRGKYDGGPHALRAQRLKRMAELGLADPELAAHPLINPLGLTEWDDMTPDERAKSARAMETYAAMVECIDTSVGRVLSRLEADGELDNTFVVFMSDNGAEGASYEAFPFFGNSVMAVINAYYDNSLDNIGEPDSFVWYGSHWAQAATAPSRLYKMFPTQGGIRVPFILRYPGLDAAVPGSKADTFTTVMDLMPTMLDLAGAQHPAAGGTSGVFRGRKVEPMRGKSWVQWLSGGAELVHDTTVPQGWELHGRAAMRIGDWKMVWMPPPYGKAQWELYNLVADPGETNDLAETEPEKLAQLKEAWEQYVADSGVVWGAPQQAGEVVEADETDDSRSWMRKGAKSIIG